MTYGYTGMTARYELTERGMEHIYGDASHEAKPWNYLVPGYDPAAMTTKARRAVIEKMTEDGALVVLWQPHSWRWSKKKGFYRKRKTCFQWYLKLRESWHIAMTRPLFNILENARNPRRVTKEEQLAMRAAWETGKNREDSRWSRCATGWHLLPDGSAEYSGPPLSPGNHEWMLTIARRKE